MQVENVNQFQGRFRKNDLVKNRQQQYFTGAVPTQVAYDVEKEVIKLLPAPKLREIMLKLRDKLKGEFGGIVINALGTGAVAPLFIAFNPLVKADPNATQEQKDEMEKTKKYTAWRQPLSAGTAIVIQGGVQKPIDKFLSAITNNPEYAKNLPVYLNKSALQDEDYIEKQVKKQLISENFTGDFDKEVSKRIKQIQNKQIEDLAKHLEKTGEIKIGKDLVKTRTVVNVINRQIDEYIKKAKTRKVTPEKLSFYTERAQILIDNEARLKEILAPDKLPKNERALANYFRDLARNEENADVRMLIKEILEKHTPAVWESRCARTLERIDSIKKICGGNFSPKEYLGYLYEERNGSIDKIVKQLEALKLDKATAKAEDIKNTILKIVDICHYDIHNAKLKNILDGCSVFDTNKAELLKKVHKNVIETYKGIMSNRYVGFNQFAKVIIGVFITLPISCNALNWIYPRFMDLFFPNLSGAKTDNNENKDGGNK